MAAAAKAKADTVSRGAHGLATETGLEITVTHLPPGTSKWNRIEHRLFSHISLNWLNWLNWRGRPLTSHEVIIETIGAVTTTTGLGRARHLHLPQGNPDPDQEMKAFKASHLRRHQFHGDWNCTIIGHPLDDPTRPNNPK